MRYLLLLILAIVMVFGGCSHVLAIVDGGTDTDAKKSKDTRLAFRCVKERS